MADLTLLVNRHGLAQKYTPDEVLNKFEDYVRYNMTDGLRWQTDVVKSGVHAGSYIQIPKRVPLSVRGFCVRAGIAYSTWQTYLNPDHANYKHYGELAHYIEDMCVVDLMNGALVGEYHAGLALSLMKRNTDLIDDGEGSRNVGIIKHEIVFTDYTDVTDTEETDSGTSAGGDAYGISDVPEMPETNVEYAPMTEQDTVHLSAQFNGTPNPELIPANRSGAGVDFSPADPSYMARTGGSSNNDDSEQYRARNSVVQDDGY